MSTEEISQPDPAIIFQKFKQYFDEKFQAIDTPKRDVVSVRELKNKLEAKELSKPGNVAQFEFCGKLEIALDNIKSAIIARHDTDAAIDAIQKAEQLVFDRKQKIKIADASKAGWSTVNRLDQSEHLSADQQKSVKAAEEEALKDIEQRKRRKREYQHGPDYQYSANRHHFRGSCIFPPFLHNTLLIQLAWLCAGQLPIMYNTTLNQKMFVSGVLFLDVLYNQTVFHAYERSEVA